MEKEKLFDLLDGFQAYENGAKDSGISDPKAKQEVREYLKSLPSDEQEELMIEFIVEKRTGKGYELEDIKYAVEFIEEFLFW